MDSEISRRRFLMGLGALVAVSALPVGARSPARAEVSGLDILRSRRYPRVFAFRQAEVLANLRSYSDWKAAFLPLQGIVAKLNTETRTDTVSRRNLSYATRFKGQHPDKMVLMHLFGCGRLPTFETEGWYAGWWLYRAGSLTLDAASAAEEFFQVANTDPFALKVDAFGESWEDLIITGVLPDGRPDFSVAEQVRLVAVEGNALKVIRGQYGSSALEWPPGSYVAPHVTLGPYYRGGDKVWYCNFATRAPRDPQGRQAMDAVIAALESGFSPGGPYAPFDGVQLDVFKLMSRHNTDADGDGLADNAFHNGVDDYALGLVEFTRRLRQVLGETRLLLVDGGTGQRPDTQDINGVELEGFADLRDLDCLKWSQALALLRFYGRKGDKSSLSYPMYKFLLPHDPAIRFSRFRLALAGALFTDSAFTFYNEPLDGSLQGIAPGPDAGIFPNVFTIWDEVWGGSLRRAGWLGRPKGPAVHLVETKPDLYEGAGVSLTDAFISGITTRKMIFRRLESARGPCLYLRPRANKARLYLPAVLIPGPDLTLIMDVYALPLEGYPATVPRFLKVQALAADETLVSSMAIPVDQSWTQAILAFRRLPEGTATLALEPEGTGVIKIRNIKAVAAPDLVYREFDRGCVFANPADAPATINLAQLLPGGSFSRLSGSPDQDPITNNGQPLGPELTLPPLDALMAVRSG